MNWPVNGFNQTITEEWDHCEHLKVGEVAPWMVGENDSFGPVSRYGLCNECYEKHKAAEEEELEFCHDCGQEKPMKQMTAWRPYDFYAPQGDEPLMICDSCCKAETHRERVRIDREDYEREMGDDY